MPGAISSCWKAIVSAIHRRICPVFIHRSSGKLSTAGTDCLMIRFILTATSGTESSGKSKRSGSAQCCVKEKRERFLNLHFKQCFFNLHLQRRNKQIFILCIIKMYSTRGTKPHRSLGICSTLLKNTPQKKKPLSYDRGFLLSVSKNSRRDAAYTRRPFCCFCILRRVDVYLRTCLKTR